MTSLVNLAELEEIIRTLRRITSGPRYPDVDRKLDEVAYAARVLLQRSTTSEIRRAAQTIYDIAKGVQ
jgi:hypothetical protein